MKSFRLYLALAMKLNCPLITADQKFKRAIQEIVSAPPVHVI